jgi:hypothetical protein
MLSEREKKDRFTLRIIISYATPKGLRLERLAAERATVEARQSKAFNHRQHPQIHARLTNVASRILPAETAQTFRFLPFLR